MPGVSDRFRTTGERRLAITFIPFQVFHAHDLFFLELFLEYSLDFARQTE